MFGASEDRARQLAYRKRRERVVSAGSDSRYHSPSSTSLASQQSHLVSIQRHDTAPSIVYTKHRSQQTALHFAEESVIIDSHTNERSSIEPTLSNDPVIATNKPISRTEQHSRQAEYLSQVLYNSLDLAPIRAVSNLFSASASQLKNFKSWENLSTSHHKRNVTAPVVSLEDQPLRDQPEIGMSIPPFHPQLAFHEQLRTQSMVSLRGGADKDTPSRRKVSQPTELTPPSYMHPFPAMAQQPIQETMSTFPPQMGPRPPDVRLVHNAKRRYLTQFPWFHQLQLTQVWQVPISCADGDYFAAFISLLSDVDARNFLYLFNAYQPPTHWSAPTANARRDFVLKLDQKRRDFLKQMLRHRANEIIAAAQGRGDAQLKTLKNPSLPSVMLYHILEAFEEKFMPPVAAFKSMDEWQTYTWASSSSPFYTDLRSASAPNFRQMQEQLERYSDGYYSGSGASTGSSAMKPTLNQLFDKYRGTAGEPDLVGTQETMEYLEGIGVDLEGLESIAAHEIVQAPAMGEMSREGFVNGWLDRQCDTIEKQKSYINNIKHDLPANRELFDRVYKYAFTIAKTPNSKQVALEPAIEFWELLFSSPLSPIKWTAPNSPWLDWWKEFLNTAFKKSVNKDMWNETLKFAKLTLTDEDMSFWTEESSWPSVIDDFVEWVKNEKRGGAKTEAMDEDY